MLTEAVGSWDMCLRRKRGEKTSLNVLSSAENNFGILCWSTANMHPISRSILSLQAPHIFHCVEQYFFNDTVFVFALRMHSLLQIAVCVCHSTCYQIKSYISPSAVFQKV